MNPIKLYWSGGERNEINFGDTISPLIVEIISGRAVQYAAPQLCDMAAIGSILEKICKKSWKRYLSLRFSPIQIWGSGAFDNHNLKRFPNLKYSAVRGSKTRNALGLPKTTPLGDPGLLINRIEVKAHKKYQWGLIPHVSDREHPAIKRLIEDNKNMTLIDLANPDLHETMRIIKSCDHIASTSLHGLVTADSYGIPNSWIRVNEQDRHTSNWKFLDYFSVINRTDTSPLLLKNNKNTTLKTIEKQLQQPDIKQIETVQKSLENALQI